MGNLSAECVLPIPIDRVPLESYGGNAARKKGQREGEARSAHVPCTRPAIRCGTSITITTHRELNRKRSGVAGRPRACRRKKEKRTSSRGEGGMEEKIRDETRREP